MNKFHLSICVFFTVFICNSLSEHDPFDPSRAPKEITTVAWEQLIVKPGAYDGKIISIGGWIDFRSQIFLFKDFESRKFDKELSSIVLDNRSKLLSMLAKNKINKEKVFNNYVVIISRFLLKPGDKDNEWIGEFTGPIEISVRDKRTEILRIFDPNAIWQ